jgi:cysteinyl-tRNA synthetase
VAAAVRTITLYDTRTRQVRPFEARDRGKVGIYACGPTVYSRVHVGNARPFVVFSQLARFLRHEGYSVTFVANITDINDKIYDAARAAGRDSAELAREMTDHYVADTDRLGIGRPDHEPLASEFVGPIVSLIEALVERGHAYEAEGDVYFRVRTLPEYGELSRRDVEQMDQGEGVEGADRKKDPLDFALWKANKPDEDTAWDSPWGRGRPGWHIECSAMAEELLGLEFDIHGGGIDLVFPHHENEAAQTVAARGRPLARSWMHNGMLLSMRGDDGNEAAEGEKMAKSVGNIRGLAEVLDEVGPEALLLYFCGGHYRQPLAFSSERLEQAQAGVRRIRDSARRLVQGPSSPSLVSHREAFWDALADDFNTARALAALYEWISGANKLERPAGDRDLEDMLHVLGLESLMRSEEAPPAVVALADQRAAARKRKDWAEADRLRDQLREMGWEVRDGPQGQDLVPAA